MYLMEGAVTTPDFQPLLTALTSSITPAQLIAVLASVVGIGMTFFLAWFGIKKAVTAFQAAVKNGRIKIN